MFHILYGLVFLFTIILAPGAAALNFNPVDLFFRVFRQLYTISQNVYVLYGISFILILVLLYNVFLAGLSNVPPFKNDAKFAKPIALAFAAIATMGIFFRAGSAENAVKRLILPMGGFGAFAFALVIFGLVYYNVEKGAPKKSFRTALFAAGLGLLIWALLTNSDAIFSWAIVVLCIAIAIWLWSVLPEATSKIFGKGPGDEDEGEQPTKTTTKKVPGLKRPGRVSNVQADVEDTTPAAVEEERGEAGTAAEEAKKAEAAKAAEAQPEREEEAAKAEIDFDKFKITAWEDILEYKNKDKILPELMKALYNSIGEQSFNIYMAKVFTIVPEGVRNHLRAAIRMGLTEPKLKAVTDIFDQKLVVNDDEKIFLTQNFIDNFNHFIQHTESIKEYLET